MSGQPAGLLGSVGLYFLGCVLLLAVYRRRVATLPADWRDHPQLRDGYAAFLETRPRDVLRPPERATLIWLAGLVTGFAAVTAAELELRVQLTFIVVVSLWWTAAERRYEVTRSRAAAADHGLALPRGHAGWRSSAAAPLARFRRASAAGGRRP